MGWFTKKRADSGDLVDEEKSITDTQASTADTVIDVKQQEKEENPPSVAFFAMFRFATKLETTLNILALFSAAAAGAAQPLMSLIFGNLTQSFVSFGQAAMNQTQHPTPDGQSSLQQAAASFRHEASKDALFLVVIGIAMFASTWFFMVVWGWTGELNAKRVRERYLQAVLRQDIAFFDKVGAGEVATRIQTDTHLVQQGTSEKVALVVQFTSAFITGFVLAYIRSWKLALALTSIFPCLVITGAVMNKLMSKWIQLSLGHVAAGGTLAEEVISTIRTAQAFGSQQKLSKLYNTHILAAQTVDMKSAIVHGAGVGTFFFVIYCAYALAFDFGTTLILRGEANAGVVVNVFMAVLIGSFSLVLLAPEMQAITQGRGAAAKLYATIDRVPDIDSLSPEGVKLIPEKVRGEIEFKEVMFNYPSRPTVQILKGLSLKFKAGQTVALVGASGSGKSTIVSLVERFYDPLSGRISLDGHDLRTLNLTSLRSQIGLVSQEPVLFATSISGNVAHGLIGSPFEHVGEEEKERLVKEACVKANADGFVSKLPNGYGTLVGERGFLLSGGQKQRIAIARAIVSDPRILLLDEATSALDTQSEGIVQNALDKAAAGRTTITIAHRLSTIRDADMIHVMGNGEVLESGTHDELLGRGGAYAKLVAAQKLREAEEGGDLEGVEGDDDEALPGGGVIDQGTLGSLGGPPLAKTTTRASTKSKAKSEKYATSPTAAADTTKYDLEAAQEIPLGRRDTSQSLASAILKRKQAEGTLVDPTGGESKEYSLTYLFRRMGALNRDAIPLYLIGALAACFTGAVYPAFGIVYSLAIVTFQIPLDNDADRRLLRKGGDRNALYFFIISIGSSFFIVWQNYLFSRAATMLTNKLRMLGFKNILRQDIEFFDQEKHSTGSLTSGLSDNPQKVNGLAGITLGAIVQSCATIVTGMIIGLIYGAKLAAVGIACIPFVVSAGYVRLRVVVLKDQANKSAHEESAHMACEATGSIRTVASLTREVDCLRLYSDSLKGPLKRAYKTNVFSTGFFALSQSLAFFAIALVFWYGSRLVSTMEYSTNQFFVCLFAVTFGAIQAGNVFGFVPDISAAKGAATDIINLLDSKPAIDAESTEGKVPKNVEGHVVLQDVHFRYPTRPQVRVLRGLDIEAKPGTYVALVGASGCGKSTVIQLIERFYDPLAGKVMMDGQEIDDFNIQEYRKHIALVSQEPTLYAGTIRFNILLGATKPVEEVTQEEIDVACRNANIYEFINSLPDAYETEVGGKGTQLSGGQKQRIAIARALLRNPKVLLLDEATSALDSQSEKIVQEALDQAAKGRTTIAIAHRLSTIQNADCIYFLQDGKVFESGTHDELTAKKGAYYEYTQLQQLSKHH